MNYLRFTVSDTANGNGQNILELSDHFQGIMLYKTISDGYNKSN